MDKNKNIMVESKTEKIVKIVFFGIIHIIIFFFLTTLIFGCGLAMDNGLGCNLIGISFVLFIIQITFYIYYIKNKFSVESKFVTRIYLSLFLVIILLTSIGIFYDEMSYHQKIKWIWGVSEKSCETGKPSLPWGVLFVKGIDKDWCNYYFGKCEKIQDNKVRDRCYFTFEGLEYPSLSGENIKIGEKSDCEKFLTLEQDIIECQVYFGKTTGDVSSCEETGGNDVSAILSRIECFKEVAGLNG
ncbi:MAG: hypothetical protein AABX29_06400, partial [Nanoarchaeota archaeon]